MLFSNYHWKVMEIHDDPLGFRGPALTWPGKLWSINSNYYGRRIFRSFSTNYRIPSFVHLLFTLSNKSNVKYFQPSTWLEAILSSPFSFDLNIVKLTPSESCVPCMIKFSSNQIELWLDRMLTSTILPSHSLSTVTLFIHASLTSSNYTQEPCYCYLILL